MQLSSIKKKILKIEGFDINKKSPHLRGSIVVPPGIEPGTHGFSVHCSTN